MVTLQSRTFRVLSAPSAGRKGIVCVRTNSRLANLPFDVRNGRDGELIVSLDSQHVAIDRAGCAFCHCHAHFDAGICWHVELAAKLVEVLDAATADAGIKAAVTNRLIVRNAAGDVLAEIISSHGLTGSHRQIAKALAARPELLAKADMLARSIDGTTIRILAA